MTASGRRRAASTLVLALVLTASGLLRAGAPQAVGTWRSLGAVPDARVAAAAVALPDGRVLITGGRIAGAETATVTLFTPADGSFTSAGQLLLPRSGHTATLLKDGRVLIAGGRSQGVTTADLEIFDPATGTSTAPATLTEARTGHAAALLSTGQVLITGGTGVDGVLDTSDVFDPSDNSVTATALHMLSPRTGASATTLIDGRVLIAGGNDGSQDLASAEVFDPNSQTFEAATTELNVPRSGHTAVLLPWNGSVLIAGGTSNGVAQSAADLFLPAQFPDPYSWGMGTFAATGALTQPRAGAVGAPHIEGYSVVLGGGATDAEVYRFPTLKTDKDDYAPGTQAIISGAGWQPDTDVTLLFQEDPAVHDDYVLTVHADTEGKIYWDQWAPEEHDLNVRFYLLAKQVLADGSERRAQITFTDARNWNLTFAGTGSGSITITPDAGTVNAPTTCGGTGGNASSQTVTSTCSPNITTSANGATVTFSANPASGSTFAGWSGASNLSSSTCSGTANPCSGVMGSSGGLTVTFNQSVSTTTAAASASATYGDSSTTLSASVTPASGPSVGSGTVTFTVKSGPTTVGSVTSPTVTNGTATASLPLSGVNAGTYTIEATYSGGMGFNASNNSAQSPGPTLIVNRADQGTVSVSAPSSATYGQSGLFATASGGAGTGAYSFSSGTSGACSVNASTGALTITSGTGSCAITATRAGDTNYNDSAPSAPASVTIGKAAAVVTVNGYTGVYDGAPHGATGMAKGLNDIDLTAELHLGSTFTNVPGGTANWTFDGDANYAPQSGQTQIVITKATPVVTVSFPSASVTYDGNPHEATAQATLVALPEDGTLSISYTPAGTPVNAGAYSASAHFTSLNENFNDADSAAAATVTITKADAIVHVQGYSGTYDGSAHGATGTATGVKGESLAAGLNLGATFTDVPGGTAHWTFDGGINYNDQTGDVPVTITRASSTVIVTCPSNVTYSGSPLTPCSASATGAGGLVQALTPQYVDNLNAGTAHASASFAGDQNHDGNTGSAVFTIDRAASNTAVTCTPASVTYSGFPQTPCSASATGVGGLDQPLSPSYANNTNVGTATASAAFGGDSNHLGSSGSQTFAITQKPLTVTANNQGKTLGSTFAFAGTEFTTSGLVASDSVTSVTLTSAGAGTGAGVGTYPIVPSNALGSGLANYAISYLNGTLTVGYGVCALYDQGKAVKQNATVPVKFYLCTASGQDVSSSAIVVTAVSLAPTAGSAAAQVEDSGNANPDDNFRFDPTLGPSGGYIFNLSTKGVPTAMWKLTFTVSGASFGTYNLGFGVK